MATKQRGGRPRKSLYDEQIKQIVAEHPTWGYKKTWKYLGGTACEVTEMTVRRRMIKFRKEAQDILNSTGGE